MSSRRIRIVVAAALAAGAFAGYARPASASAPPPGDGDTLRGFAPDGFVIGSAAAGGGHHLSQDYPDPFENDLGYRELLAAEFSSLTPENHMKWDFIHPEPETYRFGPADAIVAFAEENGQVVRGHTLLWHSQNPAWLEEGEFTADELRDILHDHITTVVGHYAGRIAQWDVANEVLDDQGELRTADNIWLRELGPEILADAFRWANEADPDALLFFNDWGVESAGPKADGYLALVEDLLADGVPVHGFSAQGHLSIEYPPPGGVAENLQRFADLGLETAITEVDVRMVLPPTGIPTDDQLATQADYFAGLLEGCLQTDSCRSFTLWGLPDTYSWVPSFFEGEGAATPWWEDFGRKPAYCALQQTLALAGDVPADSAGVDVAC